ncbi:nuclear pore complex protein Nup58 [Scaptodrosophila lebanonensis]|uniref:Nuclear pore complex protein Nup58 n=1 Tax=Drosophila lebanonensis TaxID=7225 RepID=A0A6J2TH03_DROLE|nr:nuclear pore complex protein Nup58 [Scaptodrosophila lebanonensis]
MSFFGTPTTNTGLGGPAPANSGFGFGASKPANAAPPPAFGSTPTLGAAAAAAAPGFGFGSTPASAAPTMGFGAPTTATTGGLPTFGGTGTLSAFGAPGAQTGALPGFGAPAATTALPGFGTAAATTALPAFGTPATSTPLPSFGSAVPSASVAPSFNFGTPATSAPTTAPPAFGAFASTATTAANSMIPTSLAGGVGPFAFNKPPLGGAQPTTAASLNFNTMTTTATAQPFNTSLRLGGGNILAPASTAASTGIFGKPLTSGAPQAAAPPAFVGLGGIDVSATQPKLGDSAKDGVKIKETQVPDEIVKTVDALKAYIKQQKTISSDIGRTSTNKFTNVGVDIMNIQWTLQEMANSVDDNNQQIKLMRNETAKAIQALEMAQRTQDTPAGLQYENNMPFQYFQCLVAKYEQELIAVREQITLTECHMQSLTNPQSISAEHLKRCFRQLNESFVSLAGRLHEVHQRVEEQKEQYLNLRRYKLRDASNVFEKIDNPPVKPVEPNRIGSGPTPFSNISAITTLNRSYASTAAAPSSSNLATGK